MGQFYSFQVYEDMLVVPERSQQQEQPQPDGPTITLASTLVVDGEVKSFYAQKEQQPQPPPSPSPSPPSVILSGRLSCRGVRAEGVSVRMEEGAVAEVNPPAGAGDEGEEEEDDACQFFSCGSLDTAPGSLLAFSPGAQESSVSVGAEWEHRGEVAFNLCAVASVEVGSMRHQVGKIDTISGGTLARSFAFWRFAFFMTDGCFITSRFKVHACVGNGMEREYLDKKYSYSLHYAKKTL